MNRHDLVVSTLVVGRMKDFEFATALRDAVLVQVDVLHDRKRPDHARLCDVRPTTLARLAEQAQLSR